MNFELDEQQRDFAASIDAALGAADACAGRHVGGGLHAFERLRPDRMHLLGRNPKLPIRETHRHGSGAESQPRAARPGRRLLGEIGQWLAFADGITATASAARLHDGLFYELDIEAARAVLGQRRADLWPDPERFDPERFGPSAPERDRFEYMPFGAGPRSCIGDHFAMLEATLALATIVRRVELTSGEDDFPLALPFTMVAGAPIPTGCRRRAAA